MQVIITMSCHFKSIMMAITKFKNRKRTNAMGPLWKKIMWFLQKLNIVKQFNTIWETVIYIYIYIYIYTHTHTHAQRIDNRD